MKSIVHAALSVLLVAIAIAILVEGAELVGLTSVATVLRGAGQMIFGTLLSVSQGTFPSSNQTA